MNDQRRLYPRAALLFFVILFSIGLATNNPASVFAQDEIDGWSQPVNLSHSGGATDPIIVADADKTIHIFWKDIYTGYMYSFGKENQWSLPVSASLPFDQPSVPPVLVADADNRIYGFWVDRSNRLIYSSVRSPAVGGLKNWAEPTTIAQHVIDFRVTIDQNGIVHVVYLVGLETSWMPAGIYYLQVQAGGRLSDPILIYQSPYFRRLNSTPSPGNDLSLPTISLDIMTASFNGKIRVMIAWDNPVIKSVFLRTSEDGGRIWKEQVTVAGPDSSSERALPQNVQISGKQQNAVLIWQYAQSGNCTKYYQFSTDGGESWSENKEMLSTVNACIGESQLMPGADSMIYLYATIDQSIYFSAWNGSDWSQAQLQSGLNSFPDPELNTPINFQCRHTVQTDGTIYVVGCDKGAGGDIWVTSTQVNSQSLLTQDESAWSKPDVVSTNDLPYYSPLLISDPNNKLHSFWSQPDIQSPGGPGASIYYASWSDKEKVVPSSILKSPSGKADQVMTVLDANGRLLTVWSGGKSGEIYFSSAPMEQAGSQTDWFEPVLLPSPRPASASPVVWPGTDHTISVAFSIPVNEDRGVYLTQSVDGGKNWSAPIQVFDAVSDGCEMVDQISMVETDTTSMHLTWRCSTQPGGMGPLALHYAKSLDGGKSWQRVDPFIEKPVEWSALVKTGKTTLHMVWRETTNGQTHLWDRFSQDDGISWSTPSNFTTFSPDAGPAAVAKDPSGQIYLIQILQKDKTISLQDWKFDGTAWTPGKSMDLGPGIAAEIHYLTAAIVPDGRLAALFAGYSLYGTVTPARNSLYFVSRSIQIPNSVDVVPSTMMPTITTGPLVVTSPTDVVVPTAQATITPDLSTLVPKTNSGTSSGFWNGLGVAAVLTLIVVVGAFVLDRRIRYRN